MTLLDKLMVLIIALVPSALLETQNYNMQKQLDRITSESTRCPDSKSFSLLTLRP